MSAIAQITPESLPLITWQGMPVISTELLANIYGSEVKNIQMNFSNHASRFIEGVHYFLLKGNDLKEFKLHPNNIGLQISNMTRKLYLWTEHGTVRHAKILDTDNAWAIQDRLEDSYFAKNQPQYGLKELPEPPTITKSQQGILFNKVVNIAAGRGQIRSQIWSRFQNHFKLNSYMNLPADKFDEALDYLDAKNNEYNKGLEMLYVSNIELAALVDERVKALEGEVMPKEQAAPSNSITLELSKESGLNSVSFKFKVNDPLYFQRYFLCVDGGNISLRPLADDEMPHTQEQWLRMMKDRGYVVVKGELAA